MSMLQINVGFYGSDCDKIHDFFKEILKSNVKIHEKFSVTTDVIKTMNDGIFRQYNYVFIFLDITNINHKNTISMIKQISTHIIDPRNHLFIIIDGCGNMKIDDEGDLMLTESEQKKEFKHFYESMCVILEDDWYTILKMNFSLLRIYHKILTDESIVNLTTDEIDHIIPKSKMTISEKKREIKSSLKKESVDDKLAIYGYDELVNVISSYFKLVHQKKVVCENYVQMFREHDITLENADNLISLLKEVDSIDFLKPQMMDDLINNISDTLEKKLVLVFSAHQGKIGFNKTDKDIYQYQTLLNKLSGIVNNYKIVKIIEKEKEIINHLI